MKTPERIANATQEQKAAAFEWLRGIAVAGGANWFDAAVMMEELKAPPEVAALRLLAPFADFARKWNANPIRGLAKNPLYSIHAGADAAHLNLRDCQAALKYIVQFQKDTYGKPNAAERDSSKEQK